MESFSLWLEFENYATGYPGTEDDPECDFCNVQIRIGTSLYAANVWTFQYVEQARKEDPNGNSRSVPSAWLLPPDLLVSRLDRMTISAAIRELIRSGGLPQTWLVADDETR